LWSGDLRRSPGGFCFSGGDLCIGANLCPAVNQVGLDQHDFRFEIPDAFAVLDERTSEQADEKTIDCASPLTNNSAYQDPDECKKNFHGFKFSSPALPVYYMNLPE
jgi:hypothetical protein